MAKTKQGQICLSACGSRTLAKSLEVPAQVSSFASSVPGSPLKHTEVNMHGRKAFQRNTICG